MQFKCQTIQNVLQHSKIHPHGEANLNDMNITSDTIGIVADYIMSFNSVKLKRLSLRDNVIGEQGGELLCSALKNSSYCLLERISLRGTGIGIRSIKILGEYLISPSSSKLSSLYLWYNKSIGDNEVETLCAALAHNTTLNTLNLSNCSIGNRGATSIGDLLLNYNSTITEINLDGNFGIDSKLKEGICNLASYDKRSPKFLPSSNFHTNIQSSSSTSYPSQLEQLLGSFSSPLNLANYSDGLIKEQMLQKQIQLQLQLQQLQQLQQIQQQSTLNNIPPDIQQLQTSFKNINLNNNNNNITVNNIINNYNNNKNDMNDNMNKINKNANVVLEEGVVNNENYRFKGIIPLLEGYQPPMSCLEYMKTSQFKEALPGIGDLDYICFQVEMISNDRLSHISTSPGAPLLSVDEAIAIAAYTFDLGINGNKHDGSDNLYYLLNVVLRERNSSKMQNLKPYLYYLMNGIAKLPVVSSIVVYRGIPGANLDDVQTNYKLGTHIHWSSFTSTTTSLEKAKGFAGAQGIIFHIKVINGRNLHQYSSLQDEKEIILSPNSKFFVSSTCTLLLDQNYYMVELVEQRCNDRVVF